MKLTYFAILISFVLVGCDRPETQEEKSVEKEKTQELLKGEAVKSPVLDFSKYDGTPNPAPTKKPEPPKPSSKEPSGFKKSPVLDFNKY